MAIRVPLARAEEKRAEWIARYPEGFEEREQNGELELAAYTEDEPPPDVRVTEVERGWEERWREFHRPVRIGPLWVGPPWERPPDDAIPVVVDPGRAFGTGAHATTRLCLELLTELEPAGLTDLGCGSGVIAIAAVRLGFEPVIAVDVDSAAVEATTANAALNGTPLDVRELDLARDPLPETPVAVANISLERVETLLLRVASQFVIASGYLERDRPSLGQYRRRVRRTLDGWAADLLERAQ